MSIFKGFHHGTFFYYQMKLTKDLYQQSLALLTDFYQLTMAYGYWKNGLAERESVFNLFFRSNPFDGGYAVTCGLEYVIDYLENFSFDQSDTWVKIKVHCFPTLPN